MDFAVHFKPPSKQEPFRLDLSVRLMCPECNDNNIIEQFSCGDIICGDCGLVLDGRIVDTRPEWRTFAEGDDNGVDPCRVGAVANPFLDGSQLDTIISARDGYSGQAQELTRIQTKSISISDSKLLGVYKDIDAMSHAIGLPKTVTDIAKEVYKKTAASRVLKNKTSTRSIIAACLFFACRKANVPRTYNEMSALTKVHKNDIGKAYKAIEMHFIKEAAATTLPEDNTTVEVRPARHANDVRYTPTATTSASDLMIRFCNRLQLSRAVETMCTNFASRIGSAGTLGGRSPATIAAAGIYFVSHFTGNGKSPREIHEATGVSEGTIRDAYRILFASKMELVDLEWVKNGKGSMDNLP